MDEADTHDIAEARSRGVPWHVLAERYPGVSANALRKRHARLVARSGPVKVDPDPAHVGGWPTSYSIPGRPRILLLPDTQVAADTPLDHFLWAGRYAADKQVDAVVHIGDFGDFRSVSTYNTPLSREGLRLCDDIRACDKALAYFDAGLAGYNPLKILTLGNHEDRLARYINEHPELDGTLHLPNFEGHGWRTYPFLQPVTINGVHFAHYFTRSAKGWASKNPHANASTMTRREMVSCVAGHTPGLDPYIHPAGGRKGLIRGLIAGSFYQHDETWMGPQGNNYWRGVVMLNEVRDGFYSLMEVTMDYLKERYGR